MNQSVEMNYGNISKNLQYPFSLIYAERIFAIDYDKTFIKNGVLACQCISNRQDMK